MDFFFLSKWTFLFSSAIWHCTHLDTDTGICVSYWKPVALSVKLSSSGSYWITAAEVCGGRTLHSHLGTSGAMWDQSWLPVFNGGGLYRGAVWLPTCSRPLCKCAVSQLYQAERLKKTLTKEQVFSVPRFFMFCFQRVDVKWLYCHVNHVLWYSTQWSETAFLQDHGAMYNI